MQNATKTIFYTDQVKTRMIKKKKKLSIRSNSSCVQPPADNPG